MKKFLILALLVMFAAECYAQSVPPQSSTAVDEAPSATQEVSGDATYDTVVYVAIWLVGVIMWCAVGHLPKDSVLEYLLPNHRRF